MLACMETLVKDELFENKAINYAHIVKFKTKAFLTFKN